MMGPSLEGDSSIYEDLQFFDEDNSLTKLLTLKYDKHNQLSNEESFDALLNTAYHFRKIYSKWIVLNRLLFTG